MMRFLPLLLLLLPVSAGAASVPAAEPHTPPFMTGARPSSPDCPRTAGYYAYRAGDPVKPRRLTELPPANMYAAVLRHDGRCEVPVIIKYGVGGR